MKLTTDQKGGIAELAIAWEAAQLGIGVYKPLTDGESNALKEYIVFHPIWWVYALHLEGTITVQLYDASRAEDNTPLPPECKKP